jgi:hypothetical protein
VRFDERQVERLKINCDSTTPEARALFPHTLEDTSYLALQDMAYQELFCRRLKATWWPTWCRLIDE